MSAVLNPDVLRVPPHAIDAEEAVLGSILLAPKSLAKVADWLAPDDFYRHEHRVLYGVLRSMADRHEAIDAVTVTERLAIDEPELGGDRAFVYDLANRSASAANIVGYAEIVLEKSRLRHAIEVGTQLAGNAFSGTESAEVVVAKATQALATLRTSRLRGGLKPSRELMRPWFESLSAIYQRGDAITGMPTPWAELNRLTHGLQAGDLIILAARPNMGKTVMGLQLALHAALALQRRTAVFSLEMTATQLLNRAVASLAPAPHAWMLSPGVDETYWPRVSETASLLNGAPLLIDDTPGLSAEQIASRARRANLQAPIGLLVVDHLHEIALPGRTSAERTHDLGRAAQTLKGLGKEFGCPVVSLAQLNRDMNQRGDKHPVMTDLRASGDIEQVADVILFLHREDYYDKNTHLKGVVDVEIGKGRDIPTGARIQLRNRFDVMRLDDWEGELPLPDPHDEDKPRRGLQRRYGAGRAWN